MTEKQGNPELNLVILFLKLLLPKNIIIYKKVLQLGEKNKKVRELCTSLKYEICNVYKYLFK